MDKTTFIITIIIATIMTVTVFGIALTIGPEPIEPESRYSQLKTIQLISTIVLAGIGFFLVYHAIKDELEEYDTEPVTK